MVGIKRVVSKIGHWVGTVLASTVVIIGRPWVWVGIMPIPQDDRFSVRTVHTIWLIVAFFLFLIGVNALLSLITPQLWVSVWWHNLLQGVYVGTVAMALKDDFVVPWLERRERQRVERSHLLPIPDRALDGVFEFEPGEVRFGFSPECKAWMRVNLKGKRGIYPMRMTAFHKGEESPKVWFANPNDAFAFKLRWL